MTVEVIIGHGREDDEWRQAARRHVEGRYRERFDRVTLAQCPTKEWSKGAAMNPAIQASTADILVLADADSFVATDVLDKTIRLAAADGWAMPHSVVKRLSQDATRQVLGGVPVTGRLRLERAAYPALPGGGIVVATKKALDTVGGFDPRFIGWGGEDHALGLALRTLVGPVNVRRLAPLWHLWHPPAPACRKPSQASRDLDTRYRRARDKTDLMADLVKEFA